jgi:hypothetical protein
MDRGCITAFGATNGSNRLQVAVSNSGILSSSTRSTFFQFQFDEAEPAANSGCSADFPSWGDDAIAIYISVAAIRCPEGRANSKTLIVVSKASLFGQGPILVSTFRNVDPTADPPVDVPEGEGGTGYFVSDRNVVLSMWVGNCWSQRRMPQSSSAPGSTGTRCIFSMFWFQHVELCAVRSSLGLRAYDKRTRMRAASCERPAFCEHARWE